MEADLLLQYKIFLAIAPVTIVLLLFLAALIFHARRNTPTPDPMFWLCVLLLGHIICNALEQITTTPAGTIFFAKITYLFLTAIPVVWIVFTLRYTGRDGRFRLRHLLLLFLAPVLSDILVFTNELHGLIWSNVAYVPLGRLLTMRVEHGFWFYVAALYNYSLLAIGAFIIFMEFLRSPRIYRRQVSWLLAGVLWPLIFNVIYLFHLIPGLVKDYTCFGFFFSMICFYIGIFRYRLLELLPIARTMIIEQMKDGVIILNSDMTVLDLNPQAKTAIGRREDLIGQPFANLESACPELFSACRDMILHQETGKKVSPAAPRTIPSPDGKSKIHFEVECIPIVRNKISVGHLITLHDITEQVKLLQRIEQLALTDELTGLYNRRHFMETYSHEIERCKRYQKPLSLAVLDIDFFKRVNDAYGHPAGDKVLAQFGVSLRAAMRDTDIIARLGGEEFGVLMPETTDQEAYTVFCRLKERIMKQRMIINDSSSPQDEQIISITVSIGVAGTQAACAAQAHTLLERADKALYGAKDKGRNRVTLWEPEMCRQGE